MLTKLLLVSVVGIAALCYYLWTPLPDDLDQRETYIYSAPMMKLSIPMFMIRSFLKGYTNKYQVVREYMDWFFVPPPLDADPELQVHNDIFDGVPVRVFRPASAPVPTPVLMYFHGGGWSVGSVDVESYTAQYLAKQAQVVVVYRLAPEHPFPAALDDSVKATVHVLTHGKELGLDPTKVGLTGQSAGGNLAAAVPFRLQDPVYQKLPKLAYQMPIVPCLQGMDLNLPSYVENDPTTGPGMLSRQDMAEYYLSNASIEMSSSNIEQVSKGQHIRDKTRAEWAKHVHPDLLTDKKQKTSSKTTKEDKGPVNETLALLAEPILLNYLLSPLHAPDKILKAVPRAMVIASYYDVLRDDAILYYKRLRQVGVDATLKLLKTGHHISLFIWHDKPGSDLVSGVYEEIFKFIKESNSRSK